jgi:SAM-dependent methyltransferase
VSAHSPADPHQSKLLVRSNRLATFAHLGSVYLYHDLYGYLLQMSPDILGLLDAFQAPAEPAQMCSKFANAFGEQPPEMFIGIFIQFACLIVPGTDEVDGIWDKVGVQSRWKVWEKGEDGGLTFYTAWGERPILKCHLTPDENAIWERFDGETRLVDLAKQHGTERVAALVERLAQHAVQALKLSQAPLKMYKGRGLNPPHYLISTMPYGGFDPAKDKLPPGPDDYFSPEGYYAHEVTDAEAQFDHQETTLSHLFRIPHPALQGRTYGQAILDGLEKKGQLPSAKRLRVLEAGGGLGFFARAVVEGLMARGREVDYHIVELSPALAKAQRDRTAGLPVTIREGNVLTAPWPEGRFDLILANEMVGDLVAAKLTHKQLGVTEEGDPDLDEQKKLLADYGEVGQVLLQYELPLGGAPDPCYINFGAIRLVERAAAALAPGGLLLVTEFGEMARFPVLSTQLDHPELSIHFGHLTLVADANRLKPDWCFVMDLIEMDRDAEGLATTRSYFRALQALLAEHGVSLEKIGYTRSMFNALVAGKLDLSRIGDLRFDRIEDRLMGLVPHEFKALTAVKPA